MKRFIVAEITKNWTVDTPVNELISQKFESVININAKRGYCLVNWNLCVSVKDGLMTETIVAVFELTNMWLYLRYNT